MWRTLRKVFVVGARASEMPIPRPLSDVESRGASITQPKTRSDRRRMYRMLPTCSIPGLAPICCDTKDPDTIFCGYAQRLLRGVPKADDNELKSLSSFVDNFLNKNVNVAQQMSFDDWLSRTSYNEARKQELKVAYFELRGGFPTRWQCRKCKSFCKTESYPLYKHTRTINSRTDAFKVFSGPLFKAIEDEVYKLPEFIKHVPVPDRPDCIRNLRRAGRHYYQTDFTAFESHFTPSVMEALELRLYRYCLKWSPAAARLVCDVLSGLNIMSTRTGVTASVQGRRMSGDMCTSLGNGFSNLMLAKYLAARQGKELWGYVEGDDGLFATEAVLTTEMYYELGFTIKIEEVDDPCKASFCGMIFSDSGEIVRDPIEFLATFGWTSSFIGAGPKIMNGLLRAKALSAVYETPQCPIVGALARVALTATRGYAPRFVEDGYRNFSLVPCDELNLPAFNPSPDTRELLFEKFGITATLQIELERRIFAGDFNVAHLLPPTPSVLDHFHHSVRYVEVG